MAKKMLKLCIFLETMEELRTVEKATSTSFADGERDVIIGDIDFPVVYFYYERTSEDEGDYDIYEYGATYDKYNSEQDFKRGIIRRCLEEDPSLTEMTLDELVTDYAEYLI